MTKEIFFQVNYSQNFNWIKTFETTNYLIGDIPRYYIQSDLP